MNCNTPGFPVHHYPLEFAQTHVHWVDDAFRPSHPLWPLFLPPSIFPSLKVFSSESALCIRWPKYWRFSFSISPSKEYSGLISFRIDWFDLFRQPRLGLEYNQPWNHISKKKKRNHISYLLLQKNKQKSFHSLNVPQSILCPWVCSYLMLFHF